MVYKEVNVMKYFFFDIDGTLAVGNTGIIPENTKKAIKLLQKNILHFLLILISNNLSDFYPYN